MISLETKIDNGFQRSISQARKLNENVIAMNKKMKEIKELRQEIYNSCWKRFIYSLSYLFGFIKDF